MFYKLLFFTALAAVSILAVLPNYNSLPKIVSFSDVINHIAAFFVLTLLLNLAFPLLKSKFYPLLTLHVILLTVYGITLEVIQHFLPTRYGDPFDVLSDVAGILVAYAIILKIKKR